MLLRRIVSDDDSNELFYSHVLDASTLSSPHNMYCRLLPHSRATQNERTRMAIIINIWALCMQTALFALIYTVFSSRANRVPCTKFIGSMSHISHPSPSTMPRMLLHVIEMCLAKSIIWFSGIIIIVIIPGMYIFGVWIFRFWTCPMNVIKAHSLYFSASYILACVCAQKRWIICSLLSRFQGMAVFYFINVDVGVMRLKETKKVSRTGFPYIRFKMTERLICSRSDNFQTWAIDSHGDAFGPFPIGKLCEMTTTFHLRQFFDLGPLAR